MNSQMKLQGMNDNIVRYWYTAGAIKNLEFILRANGFIDGTEWKTDIYESDTFVEEMEETWRGLKPLYEQLHAYVRNKLVKR